MDLFEIKVEIAAVSVDEAEQILLENGLDTWSLLEDAIAKRAWIVGIFSSEDEAQAAWKIMAPQFTFEFLSEPAGRSLGNQDWRDSYKAHFKAWKFGRLHWVPIWERDSFLLPSGESVIWLDPGLAFGTGNHETTRLCVERLVAFAEGQGTSGRVIDAGCGSGILALSAACLGFREVCAFDNDPEAVRVSRENASLNDLAAKVVFFAADLEAGLSKRSAELVLANIQADVLIRFIRPLSEAVVGGGVLVLSGILAFENEMVRQAFAEALPGWRIDSRILGEWSDLVLVRPLANPENSESRIQNPEVRPIFRTK